MTEEQINRLELIIKKWLDNGAQCTSSLKPYTRSLYPTYNPGIRNRSSHKSKPKKKIDQNQMIQMCEDFLRNNRKLLKL